MVPKWLQALAFSSFELEPSVLRFVDHLKQPVTCELAWSELTYSSSLNLLFQAGMQPHLLPPLLPESPAKQTTEAAGGNASPATVGGGHGLTLVALVIGTSLTIDAGVLLLGSSGNRPAVLGTAFELVE